MHIVLASSEVVPFAKTGGLADVCGALPVELEKLGHQVTLFLPAYRSVYQHLQNPKELDVSVAVPLGKKFVEGSFLQTQLPGSQVEVILVNQPNYFHRHELYGEQGADYEDNSERFIFFSRAVLEGIRLLDLDAELIHCNDWQTGMIPALLKCEYQENPRYESIRSLMTIHNIAYQGNFWHWDMLLTGLDWKHFTWKEMEHYGRLNLLKTGIVFADMINTVSPTYAREIQTAEHGAGLDSVLRHRANRLTGILNGIDTQEWNPQTDPHLIANYSPPGSPQELLSSSSLEGKARCKEALQSEMRLSQNSRTPLIGLVGRLCSQKGWSLILPVMRHWLEQNDSQWVVLGTGDPDIQNVLETLHRQYPHRLAVNLGFSNPLAHRIEAGADLFLMPSQYEPCGLNQMYSMAYGTVPVVRRTGGLADTVVNTTKETLQDGTANGFSFDEFTSTALEHCLGRAVEIYRQHPDLWTRIMSAGMARDWSWGASASKYAQLYQQTLLRGREQISHG
jgi:starch synthase